MRAHNGLRCALTIVALSLVAPALSAGPNHGSNHGSNHDGRRDGPNHIRRPFPKHAPAHRVRRAASVPELSSTGAAAGLTLVLGGALLLTSRRRRSREAPSET